MLKKFLNLKKNLSRSTPYSFRTTPFILSIAFALSVEFDFTTMAFEKPPVLSVLYLTLITPFWLGRIGSWGQDGTVQPQEENADVCNLKRALAVGAPRYCVVAEGGAAKCYDRAIVLNPLGFDYGTENHRCCKKQQPPHSHSHLTLLSYSRFASSSLE